MTIRFRALEKRIDAVLLARAHQSSVAAGALTFINGQLKHGQLTDAELEIIAGDPTSQVEQISEAELTEILRAVDGRTRGLPPKRSTDTLSDAQLEAIARRGRPVLNLTGRPEPAVPAGTAAAPRME
jgi:hypothetical protein